MTYEELLSNIDSNNYRQSRTLDSPYLVLRSIVELHKPRKYKDAFWCTGCNSDYAGDCPTIEAIKKELI
jgi:hypothetical protein